MLKNIVVKVKFFFVFFIFSLFFSSLEASSLSCEVSAPFAILINAEDGTPLFTKNADEPCYPASTTKIATALYALYQKKDFLDQKVKASHDAIAIVSIEARRFSGKHPSYRLEFGGTSLGLMAGEEMDLKSLLYGLMLASGNDAANVIAEFVSGSVPRFIEELNAFLKEIGCASTNYCHPHGLTDLNHFTTVRDLALMAKVAMQDPVFREIVGSSKWMRPKTNKKEETLIMQGNALVRPKHKYFYPYATGIKTGYTIKSGHVLVASAQKGDRSLIAVVAGCDEAAKKFRAPVQLFEAAFAEPKQTRKLFAKEYDFFHQKVLGAKDLLHGCLQKDVVVSFYPSENQTFESKLHWFDCSLPILVGQEVGEMQIFNRRGKLVTSVPLLSSKEVRPTLSYQLQEVTSQMLSAIQAKRLFIGYVMAFLLFFGAFWKISNKRLKILFKGMLGR